MIVLVGTVIYAMLGERLYLLVHKRNKLVEKAGGWRVSERAIGVEGQAAVGRVGELHRRERITLGVGVVGQDAGGGFVSRWSSSVL